MKLVNAINGIDLLNKITPEYEKNHRKCRNINKLTGFDLDQLEKYGINLRNIIEDMTKMHKLVNIPVEPMSVFHTNLVYCNKCLSSDYHSFLHQFKLIDFCPFHLCDLSSKCVICNKEVYAYSSFNNIPFFCQCGHSLRQPLDNLINIEPVWAKWKEVLIINDVLVIEWINKLRINGGA